MGSNARAAAGLACLVLLGGTPARADEPFWNSRPLSHWVAVLQTGDLAARTEAARGLTEIALAHGASAIVPALAALIDALQRRMLRNYAWRRPRRCSRPVPPPRRPFRRCSSCSNRIPMPTFVRTPGWRSRRWLRPTPPSWRPCGRVLGRDADAHVRQAAAASLVQAGPAARPCAPALHARDARRRRHRARFCRRRRRSARRDQRRPAGAAGRALARGSGGARRGRRAAGRRRAGPRRRSRAAHLRAGRWRRARCGRRPPRRSGRSANPPSSPSSPSGG